ncbi:hypothetical protein ACQKOE_09945 [Novosphingobium sp. NPDC080210]|uniref:hypothetical protein n=1 Tax=Novosphingobium sp. NPDC080210 TaxID=3390596 RepID=UPI003D00AE65
MEDETQDSPQSKPKSKAGRPKGSKSRPKWLLEELKRLPKRPRGRPPGSKNRPKTVEGLIALALEPPKPRARPKPRPSNKENYFARLKREDPEKLREISKKAATSAERKAKPYNASGKPYRMTMKEWARAKEDARIIAHRIYKIMEKDGSLPENPIAREAMKRAMEMLAEDNSSSDKIKLIRTLLEYNMAKPASTQNVNLKTAEDFLDELADSD